MKAALSALALAGALVAAPRFGQLPPTGNSGVGSIEVLVTGTAGTPLDDVDVELAGLRTLSGQKTLATTGRDGRAVFRSLAPGNYQVMVERPGYMGMGSSGFGGDRPWVAFPLAAGAVSRTVRMTLVRGSVLAGRVQDAKGRPVLGKRIVLAQTIYRYGQRTVTPLSDRFHTTTNDLGEFRIFWLPPGDYTLLADNGNGQDGTIFYPGTADLRLAGRIALKEGEVARADFILPPPSGVTISGTVTSASSSTEVNGSVQLNPVGLSFSQTNWLASYSASRGQFEIRGVPPGSYELLAQGSCCDFSRFGSSAPATGRVRLDVGTVDVRAVAVVLHEGVDVRGRFSISADVRAYLQSSPNGIYMTADFNAIDRFGDDAIRLRTGEEGQQELSFLTTGVKESQYRITAVRLPPDGYLSDLRQNGRSVYNDGMIDVGREPVELELVVNGNGGVVQGTVVVPGQANGRGPIAVALIPEKPRRGNLLLYKRVELTQDASAPPAFTFRGVAPGNYRILASDYLLIGEEMSPDFIAQHEQRGVPVTIDAGVTAGGVQVPLIWRGAR